MVDRADLAHINRLYAELEQIRQALDYFDHGGRITAMLVSPPGQGEGFRGPMRAGVNVDTSYIAYPPQMVDAIKTAFAGREHAIEAELGQLGVTGLDRRAMPQQQRQQPRTTRGAQLPR